MSKTIELQIEKNRSLIQCLRKHMNAVLTQDYGVPGKR